MRDLPNAKEILTVFLLVGLFSCFISFDTFSQAENAREWPTTSGKVIDSELRTVCKYIGSCSSSANITYQYNVGGNSYTNNKVAYDPQTYKESASWLVNRYPNGTVVNVHYDPHDPLDSYLAYGSRYNKYPIFSVGIGFILLAVVVGFFSKFRNGEVGKRFSD